VKFERHVPNRTDTTAKHQYDGYAPAGTVVGDTIRWGSWSEERDDADGYTVPITLFPYASGSDYSGNTVEASNYRVLVDDEHVMSRSVLIQGHHGTFGVAFIGYPTRRIRGILAALAGYPVLDEDDLSELECEVEAEQWADHGRADFRRDLVDSFDGTAFVTDDDRDLLTDDLLNATWYSFAQHHGDGGKSHESPDSCHFYIDECIEWLRKNRTFGQTLVLGDVNYRDRGVLDVARDALLEDRAGQCRTILTGIPGVVLIDLVDEAEVADEAA